MKNKTKRSKVRVTSKSRKNILLLDGVEMTNKEFLLSFLQASGLLAYMYGLMMLCCYIIKWYAESQGI